VGGVFPAREDKTIEQNERTPTMLSLIVLLDDHRSVHSGSVEHLRDLFREDRWKWNSNELMSLKEKGSEFL
jgi:hypothetical protein